MGIRIITDSASDISQERAKEWDVTVMPLTVRFHEVEYLDGVTITPLEFYEKLVETDELPKTSQITPYRYEEEFRKAVSEGDKVICCCLSSGVSGSYQSACLAAGSFEGNVTVIDTRQFCISEYIIVQRAAQLRDQGMSYMTLVDTIREELKDAHVLAVFDTLEYLKMGGRISSAAAAIGGLLSLKPVLTIEDGVVKVLGKARGSRKSGNMLTQFIEETGKIDFSRPVCLAFSGIDDSYLRKYVKDSAHLYAGHEDQLQTAYVGSTIGTYSGPGAIAVAFFARTEN